MRGVQRIKFYKMAWKEIIKNEEIVSYERESKEGKTILEARREETGWQIIKKFVFPGEEGLIENYYAESIQELKEMLKRLKREKSIGKKEVFKINDLKKRGIRIELKREYKEKNVEKWSFVFGKGFRNFAIVRYGELVEMDIMMGEKYKFIENEIGDKLISVLGLGDLGKDVCQNFYYFTKKNNSYIENEEQKMLLQKIIGE